MEEHELVRLPVLEMVSISYLMLANSIFFFLFVFDLRLKFCKPFLQWNFSVGFVVKADEVEVEAE